MNKVVKINVGGVCLLFLLLLGVCASCQHERGTDADARRKMALHLLDESLNSQSPDALRKITQGMRQAPDSLSYYEYFARKGRWLCQSSRTDSTLWYNRRVLQFANGLPDSPRRNSLLAYTYNCQALNYHNFHKNADEVISLYQKAYEYSLRSDVQHQAPSICANLGDAYIFKSQLPEAAAWYRRALFLADSLHLPQKDNVTLYVGLGTIYLQLNDFEASFKCYRQLESSISQMPLAMQAYYLNNYGNYYYYKKEYPASLLKFMQLKQLLEKHKKTECFDMYLCQLNIADVYLNMDSIARSEKYLAACEPFFVANHDPEAIYYCNTIRIGQKAKRGDMAAVAHILEAEQKVIGKGMDDKVAFNMRQIRNQYLRRFYLARGDYRQAYETLEKDMMQNDSLEHNRTNMRASEIMERFALDTLRLHHELAMEHKTAEVSQFRMVAVGAISFLILLAMAFVLKSMKSHKRMEENKLRVLQLKLESARNRISPHFVFNVLNHQIMNAHEDEANELMDLTKLIRANLDLSSQMFVTLATELEFVKRYVGIERRMVKDEFEFTMQIAPDVAMDEIVIPSMLVQILVENAFVHGLRGWEGKKRLTISVQRKQTGGTVISVVDNGKGFDIRNKGKKRVGLGVVTQTIAIINEHSRDKMTFSLRNLQGEKQEVLGCQAMVYVPDGIKSNI